MINHVTYHVLPEVLHDPELAAFMRHIGLTELDNPALRDTKEAGYDVRWFAHMRVAAAGSTSLREPAGAVLHLVATDDGDRDLIGLGHFCVTIGRERYNVARLSKWCVRDSGSGRVWLAFPVQPGRGELHDEAIRVEVRP